MHDDPLAAFLHFGYLPGPSGPVRVGDTDPDGEATPALLGEVLAARAFAGRRRRRRTTRKLTTERESAEFFESVVNGGKRDAKAAANWVINELAGRLNKDGKGIEASPVSAAQLGAILDLIGEGVISGKIAKDLFEIVWSEGGDPRALVEARGMKQVTDLGAIEKVVDEIIASNPEKAAQVKEKPAALGWFVGQVMKSSGGKANPQAVNDLLKKKLGV